MGRAIELITGLTTAPTGTFTAATALAGNSMTIRDSKKQAKMLGRIDTRQSVGITRLTSVMLHDSTIGMQHGADSGEIRSEILTVPQILYPQDTISMQMTGSAVAGDIEHSSFIVYYEDLPGIDGAFISASELKSKALNQFSNTITIATGTSGQYTGSAAVNSAMDAFKANTDYALVGYQVVDAPVHAIRFVGPDWGNLGVGGPGYSGAGVYDTSDWFYAMSLMTGLPCIPVMNSSNRGLTTIDAVTDENGVNPIVNLMWVELK